MVDGYHDPTGGQIPYFIVLNWFFDYKLFPLLMDGRLLQLLFLPEKELYIVYEAWLIHLILIVLLLCICTWSDFFCVFSISSLEDESNKSRGECDRVILSANLVISLSAIFVVYVFSVM